MHLTLINPPFTFNHKATVNYSQCLGILYIAANVSAHDHHVMVIDALMEGKDNRQPLSDTLVQIGLNHADTAARIIADTDVIGVSVPFSHLGNIAFELIKEIKKQFPNTPIVMGGVFPSTQPQLAMDSKADFLILGEGEQSMVQLMEHLRAGSTGKLSEGIISTHQPLEPQRAISRFVSDLDQLPFPARDLIPFDKYVGYSQRERTKRRSASLITSRGCPFKCEFCSVHPVCGFEYRPHSAKRVLAEIDHLVDQYQVSRFEIEDDNFTLHRQRAEEILEGIIERNAKGANLSWVAHNGLRIDTLKENLVKLMQASNCESVNLALEHGDEEMLDIIGKKLRLKRVIEVAKLTRKYGLKSGIFVLYGYPGETRERFERGLAFCRRIREADPDMAFSFFLAQPYPGTKLYSRAVEEGLLPGDIFSSVEKIERFDTSSKCWFYTDDFDETELRRRFRVLNLTLRPGAYFREIIAGLLPASLRKPARFLYHLTRKALTILR